jgi:hypothetical protein
MPKRPAFWRHKIESRKLPAWGGFLFSTTLLLSLKTETHGKVLCMGNGKVMAICISPIAGEPLVRVQRVTAIAGAGLEGDRYSTGNGSFNKGKPGTRQVTLINSRFFNCSTFDASDSRRNITTFGVELMDLIGKEFQIGEVRMRGLRYCDPCLRPTKLGKKTESFKDTFQDGGGLVAEVLQGGLITVGSEIIPPKKNYD